MNKPNINIKGLVKAVRIGLDKHAPEILTGIGIAGMVTCTVLAVKATPKALELIEEEKEKKGDETLKPVETVKAAWKPYIPAMAVGGASIMCLIGATSVNTRRISALAAAYKLSETALDEYKTAALETLGEKKEKDIRDKVAENKIAANPVNESSIIVTGSGNSLCYDSISGRYFRSSIDKIKKVENQIERELLSSDYISLNDFYDALGLEHIEIGDDIGWRVDWIRSFEINFSSQLTKDGEPAIVLEYEDMPRYDYDKY
jgi:hypothetical protein